MPSSAGGRGSIPGPGTKIPHASGPKNQNRKQKQYCNKFNEDFKNGPQPKKKKKILKINKLKVHDGLRDWGVQKPPEKNPM